jgi:MoxR-like ATPase
MFDVNITNEIIENTTESKPSVAGVLFNGTAVTVPVNNIASGFGNSVRALLKATIDSSGKGSLKHISYWITKSVKGERVDFIEIPNNSKTTELFNIFKKYGMYVTKFLCGYAPSTNTVYVSTKTARDMSRMPNETNAALVMYIISLMHFVREASTCVEHITYDMYADIVNLQGPADALEKLFTNFTREQTVKVQASGTDELSGICYVRNVFTGRPNSMSATMVKYAYLYDTVDCKYVGAVVPITAGVTPYTFVVKDSRIVTNFELCTIELRDDSLCTALASGYNGNVSVIRKDTLEDQFKETMEVHILDEELPEGLPTWLTAWTKSIVEAGAQPATTSDVKYLLEAYKLKMPKGFTGCDPDELKKMYGGDEYAQELYKQVKPYYDTFELGNLSANLAGFAKGVIYAMAFVGESGTGKSTAARVIPYKCGLPYVSVNFSVNIEEADLFGSMFPNAAKTKPEDPEFVWQDGIITKAVRNGYVVILEEINFARPGVLGKLNSLLDENRQLDLPNGEVLRAHPNFRIIATCNIAYEGTNRFNKALINRFDDVTVFKDLKRDEAIEVIRTRTGYSDKAKIDKVYNVYEALKKFAEEQNVNLVVSMRQLLNMFTKGKYYKDARDAVVRIMLNGAFLEDPEYQKVFEDTVLPAFDLKFKI